MDQVTPGNLGTVLERLFFLKLFSRQLFTKFGRSEGKLLKMFFFFFFEYMSFPEDFDHLVASLDD